MGLKKKKNIIILTVCMVVSFILYQLYFFLTISSAPSSRNSVIPVLDQDNFNEIVHMRSQDDKYINNEGIIKGVFYTHMPQYRPDTNDEFTCLKSQQKIQFVNVNDDYCDCEDGTDEPSTNACTKGIFYCDTQNYKKVTSHVPSSKVNDGICDCCDGSDEWIHDPSQKLLSQTNERHYRFYVAKCPNNCV